MSRNRYIKQVRKLERKQIEKQEKELEAIERRLRNQEANPMDVPPVSAEKMRRSARLAQKRRHKAGAGTAQMTTTRSD